MRTIAFCSSAGCLVTLQFVEPADRSEASEGKAGEVLEALALSVEKAPKE